jgi:hypothetical protein
VGHADFAKNKFLQKIGERLSRYVNHQLLQDGVAAAGIADLFARKDIHADGIGIGGWFLSVQDLLTSSRDAWVGRFSS